MKFEPDDRGYGRFGLMRRSITTVIYRVFTILPDVCLVRLQSVERALGFDRVPHGIGLQSLKISEISTNNCYIGTSVSPEYNNW